MDIWSKSTMVEFNMADTINICTDAAKLEAVSKLLREKGEVSSANIIADVANTLLDYFDRIETSFNKNEEEGS